jgi:hypothetical protein
MSSGKFASNGRMRIGVITSNIVVLENLLLKKLNSGSDSVTRANGAINQRCHVSIPTDCLSETGFNQARRRLKEKFLCTDITTKAQIVAYAKYGTNILVTLALKYLLYDSQVRLNFVFST